MNEKNGDGAVNTPESTNPESLLDKIRKPISRRDFILLSGLGTLGLVIPQIVCVPVAAASPDLMTGTPPEPNAKGMVIAEPTRCTGCNRCELACSSFNDGKAQPAISRIKVSRNLNFGPAGAGPGFTNPQGGQYGNFLVIQDTCRQCAHPIPCATVCPNGAIQPLAPTNARVVNVDKCTGCQLCQSACPWGMMSFDTVLNKATKCTLCNGAPECVKACPTGALQYVPWQDKSRDIPQRWVVPAYLSTPANTAATCNACHK